MSVSDSDSDDDILNVSFLPKPITSLTAAAASAASAAAAIATTTTAAKRTAAVAPPHGGVRATPAVEITATAREQQPPPVVAKLGSLTREVDEFVKNVLGNSSLEDLQWGKAKSESSRYRKEDGTEAIYKQNGTRTAFMPCRILTEAEVTGNANCPFDLVAQNDERGMVWAYFYPMKKGPSMYVYFLQYSCTYFRSSFSARVLRADFRPLVWESPQSNQILTASQKCLVKKGKSAHSSFTNTEWETFVCNMSSIVQCLTEKKERQDLEEQRQEQAASVLTA